jgi:uncharacterized protein (TIGR03905 family)
MGVCSRQFDITLSDDGTIVESVTITGGCAGNTQGVAALAKGRPTSEVIALLKVIDCRGKGTSCPDQPAQALEKAVEN